MILLFFFFFFNDTATTEIYTLSLHDALPICSMRQKVWQHRACMAVADALASHVREVRSEEHTSELQSHSDLVCRLLLEKKKKIVWRHEALSRCQMTVRVSNVSAWTWSTRRHC